MFNENLKSFELVLNSDLKFTLYRYYNKIIIEFSHHDAINNYHNNNKNLTIMLSIQNILKYCKNI